MEKIRFQGTEYLSQKQIVRVISEISDRTVIKLVDLQDVDIRESEQIILKRLNDTVVTKVIMQSNKDKPIVIYFSGIAYVMNSQGETVDTIRS